MTTAAVRTTAAVLLRNARAKMDSVLAWVGADPGASPVLIAVVNEFAKKAEMVEHHDGERTAVSSNKPATPSRKPEAATGVADASRQAVLDAHFAICIAKAKR